MPPKQASELQLAARASLVVERVADGPQIGGGHNAGAGNGAHRSERQSIIRLFGLVGGLVLQQ